MEYYKQEALEELTKWQKKMQRNPSVIDNVSKKVQVKLNTYIPDKVHRAITATIKQMVKGVLFGATHITKKKYAFETYEARENAVKETIENYKKTAAIEGGISGAGGILLGLAEFPVLLGIKIKLLFDIAAMYGFSINDYKERIFILHIFQLAYSSQQHRKKIYYEIEKWEEKSRLLPDDMNEFDWRNFQQEYRDYIDLAKMAQLIPGIGAVVGVVVNYRLLKQLGDTAMNAYRLRLKEMKLL